MTALLGVAAALALAAAGAQRSRAEDRPEPGVPAYRAPPECAAPADPTQTEAAVRDVVAAPVSRTRADHAAAVRRLTGLGAPAIPAIAAALPTASWRARAALVAALAEMDAPGATPLLATASRDPSFAVREAATVGLGKTGDAAGAAALVSRTTEADEPAWRVRAAAAAAIRRATLRGVLDRPTAAAALHALLDDPDPDVARAALEAATPLALPETLAKILTVYADGRRGASDRAQALTALRAYREPSEALLAALRRGFMAGSDAGEAVQAARAILDVRGAATLDDEGFAASVVHHLTDEASRDMRDAIVALGVAAKPWLVARARSEALRLAASDRADPDSSAFEPLLDALFQVDEAAGIDMLREVLAGPQADALHAETRRTALRKAELAYAARMGAELRALLGSRAGRDVYKETLRAVAASGGDDVAGFVEAALRDPRDDVRSAAMDVLNRFPRIPTPPVLAEIAATAVRPRERADALSSLGRRDRDAAARVAATLLGHPDPGLREAAILAIEGSRDPAYVELLRARLRDEDGRSSEAARTGDQPAAPPAATTGSDVAWNDAQRRRTIRSRVLRALRSVAGEASRPLLLEIALRDPEAKLRETALQELRDVVRPEDAERLVTRVAEEPDADVRVELRRVVATLGDSPEAKALFDAEIGSGEDIRRAHALRLLTEERSRVVPRGLERGLEDMGWADDERASALRILERAGRRPATSDLAKLAKSARTQDLLAEACRSLAADPSPAALDELGRLLTDESDPERRSHAAQALGERGSPALVPALVAILDATRSAALAAPARTAPPLQLYRQCAIALGRIGGADAGRALVANLLHPDLAALGAARSRPRNGPFQPEEGAVVTIIRTLVAAAAHADEAALTRFVGEELDRRAASGARFGLDEEYVDGVARYLSDPVAYELPPRRRPAAALALWMLVAEGPPRWSSLDSEAWERAAVELETAGNFTAARDALRRSVAVADVEEAARPREERQYEQAKIRALEARAAAAEGRADDASKIAAGLRDADPASADLASLQGWTLVRIGRPGPDAAAALREALSKDARSALTQFRLAWVVEGLEGAERAVPVYLAATETDGKRVEDLGRADYLTHRRGRHHRCADYHFWYARAAALAGHDDVVGRALQDAIRLDDRFAAQARAQPAFAQFDDLDAWLEAFVQGIPHEPLR